MRILVQDMAGHPLQMALSEELAARGHEVMHVWFAGLSGPKGTLSESSRVQMRPVSASHGFRRYGYRDRMRAHAEYGQAVCRAIDDFRPDVVLSGNAPTDVSDTLLAHSRERGVRFVHWVQDFYPAALEWLLRRRLGRLAHLAVLPYVLMERQIFREADAVVYISPDFEQYARRHGYQAASTTVIENWAPIRDLSVRVKANPWACRNGLDGKFVFLYAGTMGLKHDPEQAAAIARAFRHDDRVRVVVVSQGPGRDRLEQTVAEERLTNLLLFDFQPWEEISDVLGTADVLFGNVAAEASVFCVPSKILTYLCAQRPVLLAAPKENLSVRLIARAGCGVTCRPGNNEEVVAAAHLLRSNPDLRAKFGASARRYAEATFCLPEIAARFEDVLTQRAAVETVR